MKDYITPSEKAVLDLLPDRPIDAHKGDFGKVLILAGSVGFTGAATLAARAALRCGSGLVFLGVPKDIYQISAIKNDEAIVFPLPCIDGRLSIDAMPDILSRLAGVDVCLLGPGLGQSEALDSLVCEIIRQSKVPLVIDADGINAVSRHIDVLRKAACPIVLTPHQGEFQRLAETTDNRLSSARAFAREHGCVLVLKGHSTVTAFPDGKAVVNNTGNPGMATGGSGDVLAGMIASLIGQGLGIFDAAWAGVWLHGKAGDVCAEKIGQFGMLPSDMLEVLPNLLP